MKYEVTVVRYKDASLKCGRNKDADMQIRSYHCIVQCNKDANLNYKQ